MSISVAFLRGMNLGKRRITNQALREAFEGLGFRGVATYRASGNVLFEDEGQEPDALTERIERGLEAALGYAVPTFLRTAEELASVASFAPFPDEAVQASAGKLQVTMLREPPGEAARAQVLGLAPAADALAFGPRELYWLPSGGVLESELDVKAIARVVGDGTMRTLGTIENIVRRCGTG